MSRSFLNVSILILSIFALLSLFVNTNMVFGLVQYKSLAQIRTIWYSHFLLSFLSGIMIVIYYFKKSYRLPFLSSLVLIVIGFFNYGAVTLALEHNAWERIGLFIAVTGIINTITKVVYGLSLILTNASQEKWLRVYGYGWVIISALSLGEMIEFFNHSSHFTQWLGIAESFSSALVIIFLILNLRKDLSQRYTNDNLLDDSFDHGNL